MAQDDPDLVRTTEALVREIFEAAHYEISEAVGERPGEVLFFAEEPQRVARLRIYWEVWERCPGELGIALDALDQRRIHLGADRALAVLAQGHLPEGYRHDLHARRVNAFTLRRLAFEMLGVFQNLRTRGAASAEASHHPDQFLPRRLVTERGDVVDAVEYLESFLDRDAPWLLLVKGELGTGRSTLLAHLAYRRAHACLADPDRVTPLLGMDVSYPDEDVIGLPYPVTSDTPRDLAYVLFADESYPVRWSMGVKGHKSDRLIVMLEDDEDISDLPHELVKRPVYRVRVCPVGHQEIRNWYRARLPQVAYAQLNAAQERSSDVAAIAGHLFNLSAVRRAAVGATENSATTQTWLAQFVTRFAAHERLNWYRYSDAKDDDGHLLAEDVEAAALEEFALGSSTLLVNIHSSTSNTSMALWFDVSIEASTGRFVNRLIRDYFLARKIAAEVRTNGPDIFARYQFPEEHVLLLLAMIAPDVAAQATADRSAELRAHIQEEVEHQLQLTLAHPLKRSVGALRTNLERMRRALPDAVRTQYAQELSRIDDEINFLMALAENTRRWHEVPEEPRQNILLEAAIDNALSQHRDSYDGVTIALILPAGAIVRAGRHTLQEILHCLLENAFHAVRDPRATQPPHVEVRVTYEGTDIVRIEVLDSGPGVDPADRERIFEPRVTTKKGGPGRPLGTGMGLAIARKYAHAIGGRIEIDPAQPQTCFVLKLVAGGMHRG